MRRYFLLTTFIPVFLAACASTTFKPNPGKHDKGLRYYRPKPYLLVTQAKNEPEKYVDIALQYLPDFTEEYSVHIRTGIGKNQTKVTLNEGWNLVSVDANLDSEIPENIKAISDLVGSVGNAIKPTEGSQQKNMTIRAAASNVPIGYYESVISKGPDNKKRLYGWRYIGFGPLGNCPVETGGLECAECHSTQMFALVMVSGVMSFVPFDQVPHRPMLEAVSGTTAAPSSSGSVTPSPTFLSGITAGILQKTNQVLKKAQVISADIAEEPEVTISSNTAKVTIKLPPEVLAATLQETKNKIIAEAKGVVAAADATLQSTVTFAVP